MNNLEPVNRRKDYLTPNDGRQDSLSPRAKIGDVVIVKELKIYTEMDNPPNSMVLCTKGGLHDWNVLCS